MTLLTDKILYPLSSEAYFRKARVFFREGKAEQAIDCLSTAYELSDDLKINIFYSFVLAHNEQYEKALEIMNEEKAFYQNTEAHAVLYTKVLVEMEKFIEAEYIIQKYLRESPVKENATWKMLEQELDKAREKINLEESKRKEKIRYSLGTLKEYSHQKQIRTIHDAELLDLADLQEVAPSILISSDIGGIIKGGLLELLIEKKDPETYSFLWFNQMKEVSPTKLPKLNEVSLVQELSELLEEKLMKHPTMNFRIQFELMHDLLLLYPYIEETITDIDFWLDAYISELDYFEHVKIQRIASTEEEKKMMEWIKHLNLIAQR